MSRRCNLSMTFALGVIISTNTPLAFAQSDALRTPQLARMETRGPATGSLVIVGGGRLPARIADEFIRLAGGIEQPFVIIPTANVGEDWGDGYLRQSFLARRGAQALSVLHTRDREVANSEAFVQSLLSARGVWIDGGRQWRLADAYLETRTHRALRAVLERGGVIGGTSAGATIQGDYLVRGAVEETRS